MKKSFLFGIILSSFSLFGMVEKSIIPDMDQLISSDLGGKINVFQKQNIETLSPLFDQRLRVISFNMLLNWSESHLKMEDRWIHRKNRLIEYLEWANGDLIGSQELSVDQINEILSVLGEEYCYYGTGPGDGSKKGEIAAIFYRKKRLELIKGETFYFSETPECISTSPFGGKNTFTCCHFRDLKTGQEFYALNTHLAFGNIERRGYEACKLQQFLLNKDFNLPVLITGDFNTFSFRQNLDIPFFDGDNVVQIIEKGGVCDSEKISLFGHLGPISSTNYCAKKKIPFCSEGTPGIILDHIFVSKGINVLIHGIDSAKVDGRYPSDHFPVITDLIIY